MSTESPLLGAVGLAGLAKQFIFGGLDQVTEKIDSLVIFTLSGGGG